MAIVRKRTGTAKDGQKTAWVVDYRDGGGIRRQKSFKLRKEADAFLSQASWEVRNGLHTADSQSTTVAQACDLWLQRAERNGLEPTTVAGYDQRVRLHIKPLLGGKKLNQLTSPMIENFRDDLVNTRTRATAKKALGGLSMVLEECVRHGLVARNVAKGVQIKKQRGKKLPVIPNKAELRAFLNAADACADPMLRVFAYLLVFSGLRASEVRGLPWRSINFNSGTITIYQRADRNNRIGATKTDAGLRTIPLPPSVLNSLRKWQPQCPASAAELVFPSKRATPIFHPNLVLWLLDPLQIAAKLTKQGRKQGKQVTRGKYGMHSFRHAAASLWIERHVDSKRIQTWMGHSSIQVTFDTYGHLFEQAHSDAAIILEIERDLLSPCDNDATNGLAH